MKIPVLLFLSLLLAMTTTTVKAKSTDIRKPGVCNGRSTSKIKVSEEDGGLEIEFEVDMNLVGRRWLVVINQGGRRIHRKFYRTNAASGSFSANVLGSFSGKVQARAVSSSTGEVCTASV
jgi:hypothetical protein